MYHQDYDHIGNAFLRLQVLLIAFSFGAIIEGTSGFGTPVAYGAIGTPIVTLAAVSGLDQLTLSTMVGRQLPWVSLLVPFWLVVAFVKMERGTWKEAFEVWPAALVSGGSFAIMQHYASSKNELHLMTDVVSGVVSVICTALFLRYVWHPKTRFLLRSEREAEGAKRASVGAAARSGEYAYPYTVKQTIYAWVPWAILIACCALWGMPEWKKALNGLFSGATFATSLLGGKFSGSLSLPTWQMPALHQLVQRMPPIAPAGAKPEAAVFAINWLSAAGTGVFVAAILSGLALRLTAAQWKEAIVRTAHRMKVPVLVIGQV